MTRVARYFAICILQFAICSSSPAERPLLEILWSERNCPPCRALVMAWNGNPQFREWTKARFKVTWTESNEYPLPRFVVCDQEICGYQGLPDLGRRLQQVLAVHEANCRDIGGSQPSHTPTPTQVLPDVNGQLLAEIDAREQRLRGEIAQHISDMGQRLAAIDESLHVYGERLNELTAVINTASQASQPDCDCAAQLAEVRTELAALRGECDQRARVHERWQSEFAEWSRMWEQFKTENTLLSQPSRAHGPAAHTGPPLVSDAPAGSAPLSGVDALTRDDHPPAGHPCGGQTPSPGPDAGSAPVDLSPILARLAELEQRINQPLTVELFDSGKPLGLIKQVNPHGGYLSLDVFGEERVLSQHPVTPAPPE